MRSDVSARFKAHIGQTAQWVTEVTWTNDGITWLPAALIDGSVTRSLSDSVHWKASLTLGGVDAGWAAIQPLNTRLRIRHGLQFAPGDVELFNFGLYRVTEANQDDLPGSPVEVEAESYESFVIGAELERPTQFAAGPASARIDQAVRAILGDSTSIAWDARLADKSDTPVPAVMIDSNRWDVVDGDGSATSVAGALGARVAADSDGGLLVLPVPTLQDEPVGEIALGPGGLLVSSGKQLTADGVANEVVVTGASVDGLSIGPVIVRDDDPTSATYYARPVSRGGFGRVVYRYTNALLGSTAACVDTAQAKLAERVGLRQQVTFSSGHNPLVEPGDVWLVNGTRVILDSVTYSLSGGALEADTRAQAALEDGSLWDVPVDGDAGDVEDLSGEGG